MSIATSRAQNDGGVFELNFRDERYMPFEGAGAVSDWKLKLPNEFRSFDYSSIADVLVHISYTAKDDERFGDLVESKLVASFNALADKGVSRAFSLSQEFATEFRQLFRPNGSDTQKISVQIDHRHFPYFLRKQTLKLIEAVVALKLREPWAEHYGGVSADGSTAGPLEVALHIPQEGQTPQPKELAVGNNIEAFSKAKIPHAAFTLGGKLSPHSKAIPLTLEAKTDDLVKLVADLRAAHGGEPIDTTNVTPDALHEVIEDIHVVLRAEI